MSPTALSSPAGCASTPDMRRRHVAQLGASVFVIRQQGFTLLLDAGDSPPSHWRIDEHKGEIHLVSLGAQEVRMEELLAMLAATFDLHPMVTRLVLVPAGLAACLPQDLLFSCSGPLASVDRDIFWQLPAPWLPRVPSPQPLQYTESAGNRHPIRPPKRQGPLYQRHIRWLDAQFSLRCADTESDLPAFHRWMNDPVVSHFWEEQGDLKHHRDYMERTAADPHAQGMIACLDCEPFAYIEAYWAKEDRIAPFYDAGDHDRGWHALVGEARFRGRPFITAWLPSLSHYLFLDDCRTQRIVVEPRVDNHKMRHSLPRCGYALLKEFDFPHKRAVLGMLTRERFFKQAIWIPQPGSDSPAP